MDPNQLPSRLGAGDTVRVADGPFRGLLGSVTEVVADRGQVKVEVAIAERTALLWLDFALVEPV